MKVRFPVQGDQVIYYRNPGDQIGLIAIVRESFKSGMVYLAVYHHDTQRWVSKDVVYQRDSAMTKKNPALVGKNGVWDFAPPPAFIEVADESQVPEGLRVPVQAKAQEPAKVQEAPKSQEPPKQQAPQQKQQAQSQQQKSVEQQKKELAAAS